MRLIIFSLALLASLPAPAQSSDSVQKSLGATLEVYVFPKNGQDSSQQSNDEATCYEWAVENTDSDPFSLADMARQDAAHAQTAQQQAGKSTKGAGVKGAVGGAAVGALIGEIVDDDAGKGAAWGAAVGGISSRRRARRSSTKAQQEIEQQSQQSQQATAKQIENFKKAFSVCLEAKEYLVKF